MNTAEKLPEECGTLFDEMALIALIDDDTNLLDVLSMAFEDAGHQVVCARDGREGLTLVQSKTPAVVLSDVNMPHLDGFALCKKLREAKNPVPIVLLTSRDNEIDEALGLELGADDYIAKPFSTRVLLARVSALLRREALRGGAPQAKPAQQVGKLTLDAERLEVRYAGEEITVTVTEFRLLETLTSRPGIIFSRTRLLELVRGDETIVAERIIDTYIRRLRRKFEAIDTSFDSIETVVGAGYRWRSHA